MDVAIDTSILRQDPKREKAAMRALGRLASGGKVAVHMPEVVQREFVSQQTAELENRLRNVETALSSILRISANGELSEFAEQVANRAKRLSTEAAEMAASEFSGWLTATDAIVYRIVGDHGRRVMDAYFNGTAPYKSPKNRSDIPDSFIWECVLDIQKGCGTLHIVSSDGALFQAASGHPGLIDHNSLEEFIQSDACQIALREVAAENVLANMVEAGKLLASKEELLLEHLESQLVNELANKDVKSRSIPDDNNEATIMGVDSPVDVSFDYGDVDYYGDGEIGLAFKASVECTLNYAIYKGDYYGLRRTKLQASASARETSTITTRTRVMS
jgi:hypothetical protein